MVIIMQAGAAEAEIEAVIAAVKRAGFQPFVNPGVERKVIDLLMASEYVMLEDNPNVVLCERGITTFEDATRYTMDLSAIPAIKRFSHLPVIADPSHAAGDWRYVTGIALAAIASGADGIMVEVHPDPPAALSDGPQSLRPEKFADLMRSAVQVAAAVGRELEIPGAPVG